MSSDKFASIAVLGAGTMGAGIAQLAASFGHQVLVYDSNQAALQNLKPNLEKILRRLVEKGRMDEGQLGPILSNVQSCHTLEELKPCGLVIEAVIEDLSIKQRIFEKLENIVSEKAILATNTSSLPVTAIASACQHPERVLGIHFFNPAPLMPLVEIIDGLATAESTMQSARALIDSWNKVGVRAKDTPGFIVNRIARPFYGEAMRIREEGLASESTIDWAMKEIGGFRMGPFELMDFIGNDVNYQVSESVFAAFYYDPRYKPSLLQRRLVEAKRFGRKTGRGWYDYGSENASESASEDTNLGNQIFHRILCMLINEAVDALFLSVASKEDIDLAMTKGVNYPKGLLRWADELGLQAVLDQLEALHSEYGEDRYRPSPLLRRMARTGDSFWGVGC